MPPEQAVKFCVHFGDRKTCGSSARSGYCTGMLVALRRGPIVVCSGLRHAGTCTRRVSGACTAVPCVVPPELLDAHEDACSHIAPFGDGVLTIGQHCLQVRLSAHSLCSASCMSFIRSSFLPGCLCSLGECPQGLTSVFRVHDLVRSAGGNGRPQKSADLRLA